MTKQEEKAYWKKYFKQAKTLLDIMGFKGLKDYSKMYGTTVTTWGKPGASMWFVTLPTDEAGDIADYEINSTYFKLSPEIRRKVEETIKSFKNESN
jgi:hypothetical protein